MNAPRTFPLFGLAAALLLFAVGGSAQGAEGTLGANAALSKLVNGNAYYARAESASLKAVAGRRMQLAKGQKPFAVIVACSDSRVSPEIIFHQHLGDLFVVRTAGNLVDDYALGSIEYAVEHLGSRLVVVVGHERCGAVGAALHEAHAEGHVREIVKAIAPAVKLAKREPGDPLENAVQENARAVAAKIAHSKPALSRFSGGEPVIVKAAYYDLHTGEVQVLD